MGATKTIGTEASDGSFFFIRTGGGGKVNSAIHVKMEVQSRRGSRLEGNLGPREDGFEFNSKGELLVGDCRSRSTTLEIVIIGECIRTTDEGVSDEFKASLLEGNRVGDGIDLIVDEELVLRNAMDGEKPSRFLGIATIEVTDANGTTVASRGTAIKVGTIGA